MAELNLDPLEETDLLNADSLNSRFTAAGNSFQDTINNLVPDSVGPGCFNENHAPSPVLFQNGVTVGGPGPAAHTYTWAAGATNNNNIPPDWTVLNTNGDAGTGTDLEINLGTTYDLTSTTTSQGVLVMADIHLTLFNDGGTYNLRDRAVFAIQVNKDAAGGTWETITRTLRHSSPEIPNGVAAATGLRETAVRIPIRTLVKEGDTSNDQVRRIRVVTSIAAGTVPPTTLRVTLAWTQLSAIVLKAART